MAYAPEVNNTYASTSFSIWGYGEVPVTMQYQLENLPSPSTQSYAVGTLLAQSSTDPSKLVIYDSTAQATKPFKAVFFDETAQVAVNGVQPGYVYCAINDRPSTLWLYSVLKGANSGTTDIDYLIANGYANVIEQYENGQRIKLVQFKGLGVGA